MKLWGIIIRTVIVIGYAGFLSNGVYSLLGIESLVVQLVVLFVCLVVADNLIKSADDLFNIYE